MMYFEEATHNYILNGNCVYEYVSYDFNIILNICTLNARITKESILLTMTWQFQRVQLKKSVCLRERLFPPVLQSEKQFLRLSLQL
jgi:hypothetical protein